jgi:hypothetical protein
VAQNYETLSDSQKNEVKHQIYVFNTALEETKDSLINSSVPGGLDTSKLNRYYRKLDKIAAKLDSSQQQYYTDTKEVLSLVNELSLPIGWSSNSAPVSWFAKKKHHQKRTEKMQAANYGFYEYVQRRDNQPNFWDVVLYLLGITITGFSLSFGAPFWFDALAKLVNIRRSGNKPAIVRETK